MSKLLHEFNNRLGSVKIYDNKVEYIEPSGWFGFGEKITMHIEYENIWKMEIIKANNISILRIYAIDKNNIIVSNEDYKNTHEPYVLNITMGLKSIVIQEIFDIINKRHNDIINNIEKEKNKKARIAEEKRLDKLSNNISLALISLDQNKDGEVDLIENGFNKIFSKNQKRVVEIDKNYIHQFVRISNFIRTKKQNTQKIFESIRDTSSQTELEERLALLRNQIHSYELLVFHSVNMIGALVSEDLITFYEIYESFDKLGMFNSNWENEVSEKLSNIGDKLDDLMHSIYNMEQNIVSELSHLSYITQESFEDLNKSVTSQLKEVESSINTNNLLTGIQTYQLYKINKNKRSLRN